MTKIGRNEPCPCGSGKKYKNCCMAVDDVKTPGENNEVHGNGHLWVNQENSSVNVKYEELTEYDEMPDELSDEEYEEYMSEFEDEEGFDEIGDFYDDLTEEEIAIVDDWLDRYYELEEPDEAVVHIKSFLAKHLDLAPYIDLPNEVLLDVAYKYLDINQYEKHIDFILELRQSHPDIIEEGFGYFEKCIIIWKLAQNKEEEIKPYLDYFSKNPLETIEELFELKDILLALNRIDLILPVLLETHKPIYELQDMTDPSSLIMPIVSSEIDQLLMDRDVSRLIKALAKTVKIELREDFYTRKYWEDFLETVTRPFDKWPDQLPVKKGQKDQLFQDVSDNYMWFLKTRLKVNYATAEYLGVHIHDYLLRFLENRTKSKKTFNFTHKAMSEKLEVICGELFPDYLRFVSTANAIYYFVDYLLECRNLHEDEAIKIKSDLGKIYEQFYLEFKDGEEVSMLFKDFPIIY